MAAAVNPTVPAGVELTRPIPAGGEAVLTPEALAFVADLQRTFNPTRRDLLAARQPRLAALLAGERPTFSSEGPRTDPTWRVAPTPDDLQARWVEITGPTDAKMVINALNSGASVFMADFEDANSPTWENMVLGQANLTAAIERRLRFASDEGKSYRLNEKLATLLVRPRGWHLPEKHLLVDGEPVSGALFDFGLYFYHNAQRLIDRGSGPYFYLAKLENAREAQLWDDVFRHAQTRLGLPVGTIRATVLIETILAAFEMDEILYALRDHASGLNAGRWDYIFSVIKKFQTQFVFPDREQITMRAPFMRAYTELLVQTCHRRGAHAMGGMAAFIPSRRDEAINRVALAKVRDDKLREVGDGFDGTWVAHPDLVPLAREVFAAELGDRPHQKARLREEVAVTPAALLDFAIPGGAVTAAGLSLNMRVAVQYLESWLRGVGAVGVYNLMEDVATAEISRAQVWQWIAARTPLVEGGYVDRARVLAAMPRELEQIATEVGTGRFRSGRYAQAAEIFTRLATATDFPEFLTLAAYDLLP
jgi:malate synthase